MNEEQADREPWETHPLIVNLKRCVPHLVESGAFAELALSTEDTRVTGRLVMVHMYGRFRPGRSADDARVAFEELEARLAAEGLFPEVFPSHTWRESDNTYLKGMDLLMAWEEPRDEDEGEDTYTQDLKAGIVRQMTDSEYDQLTSHSIETLYKAED